MVFTSWAFVRFFAVVLLGLRIFRTRTSRQLLLLVASAYFYAYANPWYLLILATPSLIDFFCAIRIEDSPDPRTRRRWLIASLVTNLGLLGYFKYADFFVSNVAALVGGQVPHLNIVLPIGISFYTFKTLSYTIDVYRREIVACRRAWQYTMFVMYFPELVAGPIVRASVFLPQMGRSLKPSWPRALVGSQVVLLGVTKKLFVADRLAIFVDPVFATPGLYASATVTAAVIAYSLQIYCDFSGYSDIAIGISRIIGFDLPENFNMPYAATSITEFWRRWHMTLSSWLRDYLYIPLGGNRKGPLRTYVNLMATMLLGGLWHGANWTFVFWGLLHGVGLAGHKFYSSRVRNPPRPWSIFVSWLLTYCFVCFAWVFFRSHDFASAMQVLRKILWLDTGGTSWVYMPLFIIIPIAVLAHWIGVSVTRLQRRAPQSARWVAAPQWLVRTYDSAGARFAVRPHPASGTYMLLPLPGFLGAFALTIWAVGLFLFASVASSPFIYFRF
jgi:alginate O-acetyltransferase complex protein AlgI